MALAVRSGHPLTAAEPTMERFADATHVVVSRRGLRHGRHDTDPAHRWLLEVIAEIIAARLDQ